MTLVVKDRVRETSTTTGTIPFTLAGAVTGFQSFSAIGDGNTTYYTAVMGTEWEVGIGVYQLPNLLSRSIILASSNSNLTVNFSSGTKDVFCTFPAEGFAIPPAIGGTTPNTITGTTVSATTQMSLPAITVGNSGIGVLQMVDGLDGYDYLNIYTYDPGGNVQVKFPYGINVTGGIDIGTGGYTGGYALFLGTGGGASGSIALRGGTNSTDISLQAPASPSAYTLTLPTTAGSNNQVLKTDGSGNLSWLDFGSPPAIGNTTANTGAFTTLSSTSIATTSSIARAGGKTSVTSILNQATFTTGGTTLASQTAAANATWRIRAFGTFAAQTNVTARTAQVAVFWGNTQLGAITSSVLVSVTQTTQWQLEFTVTASSTTAVWTAGQLMNRLNSATALALDTVTAASTTVTAGAQTIDLRFRVSTAVASEGWNVQSVTIERLV